MAAKQFKWTGPETYTRSRDGSGGAHLRPGQVYATAAFSEDVIAEWAKTGNAELLDGPGEATDTKLEVHNATISSKAPKIGAGK